jgi:DNA replication and repair protein RecF
MYGSQGQIRSIILALKLAVVRYITKLRKESPVILLDDVTSELDETRKRKFLDLLSAFDAQVLITGTDEKVLPTRGGRFTLTHGEVSEMQR